MKNSDFNYSFHYANWHSDTPESRQIDINNAKYLFDLHGIYPKTKDAHILEIGCGMGRFMLMLQNAGYKNLTGIDIDKSQIEIAKRENLDVQLADATEFITRSGVGYDVIYAFDILEHIDKEKQLPLLKAMFAATIDDGFVVFSVPNGMAPLAVFFRYIDFTHTVSYTDNTIRFLLHNAGFHYTAIRPQHQENDEVQKLKLPWARLYRTEFGLHDFILTPNIIAIAFKTEDALNKYLSTAPKICNDYAEPMLKLKEPACLNDFGNISNPEIFKMPKLSVIISVYNVVDYLRQCLDSVINQTLRDIEIVCVNDGSTDGSDKIIDEYAKRDKRIIVINQPNAGLSAARNAGIRRCLMEKNCKYISFLDSDDWVAPDFYEKLVNAAEESNADIAAGDVVYWYHQEKQQNGFVSFWTFGSGKKLLQTIDDKKEIARSCAVWNKIYRTNLILSNNLSFYHGKFVEDFPFTFCSVALSEKIVLCRDAKMYYRQRETSIMANTKKQSKIIFDAMDNHEALLTELEEINLSSQDKKQWRQILQEFTIDNLFGWLEQLNPNDRDRFFVRFVKIIANFDTPTDKWRKVLYRYALYYNFRLLSAEYKHNKIEYKLLGLPIWKIKNKGNYIKYYLFGIPIYKV